MSKVIIKGLGSIDQDSIDSTSSVTAYPSNVKPTITKNINKIIKVHSPSMVKSGKTGNYNDRRKKHTTFNRMFLLYKSTSKQNVEELETYYNKYLRTNHTSISANIREGSAGTMTTSGNYFLYLIIN